MVGQLVPLLRGQARGPGPKEAQGPADPPPQQQPAPATSSALSEPQQVVLRHRPAPNSSAETPVTFVIWRPRPPARAPQAAPAVAPAGEKQLPVIFFLNGGPVAAGQKGASPLNREGGAKPGCVRHGVCGRRGARAPADPLRAVASCAWNKGGL
ncbi:hypothetical protein MNEG_13662 [Monoraphidium neglectum]|uniref:Uncharacterized protein n=1 Tax=Monoraphidium neglectum TaxID=145388 RepID=A0A0D2MGX8_9CHLO|nr:hypothetical protein MNEG_13662 [Monoraphidium neglectum]KIY94300.1 hypothetical protein MNEG_13662 [Monoraphidium neglectum]|eukprot:XP_013893320.1 hypothetical protein MNEG_13662 [Monoraphidium neglectum]